MSIIKKTSAIIISAVILFSLFTLPANAAKNYGGKYGKFKWSLNAKTGKLTISGKGKMSNFSVDEEDNDYDWTPWYDYSDDIKSVEVKKGITYIGYDAFKNLTSLKNVKIANTVKGIGIDAFENCKKLKKIKLSNKLKTIGYSVFYNCKSLKSIKLPKSVRTIKSWAFANCKNLKKITLPDSVKSIGLEVFKGTAYYKNKKNYTNGALYVGKHLVRVKKEVAGNFKIKKGTKTIAELAIEDCDIITGIYFPASLRYLSDNGINACYNLEKITVNENNKHFSAKDGVLFNKKKTTLIKYPVNKAGAEYKIPDSVTAVYYEAFRGNANLENITFGNKVETIGASAFDSCEKLTKVILPSSVKKIGRLAFSDCKALTSIELPNGIKTIPDLMCSYCKELTQIVIPDSVTKIGEDAFYECEKLETVTIPASVKDLDYGAFYGISENATVYGVCNSDAQEMCKSFKYKFIDIETGTVYDYHNMKDNPAKITAEDTTVLLSDLMQGDVVINPIKVENAQGSVKISVSYDEEKDKSLKGLISCDENTGAITLKKSNNYIKRTCSINVSIEVSGNMQYWPGESGTTFKLTIK